MEDRHFLCALNRITFLSAAEKLLIADLCGSENDFMRFSLDDISSLIQRRLRNPSWDPGSLLRAGEADAARCESGNARIVWYWDGDYPPQLREIYDPPFLLFVRGVTPPAERPLAAVVGTRRPTGSALKAAYNLCLALGNAGISVVSGLARGIDAAAHRGCLDGGCPSFAVFGTGIDTVYPKENKPLAADLLDGGGFISEFPPGVPPLAYNFPSRNRIISGLARVVVIAQAPEHSGALITADYALDQGREVMVLQEGLEGLPGKGTARIAYDGACVVQNPLDLVTQLGAGSAFSDIPAGEEPLNFPPNAGRSMAKNLEDELCGTAHSRYGGFFRRL
ncbi:MAG: DNA-protecting protein DprA [Spirochaetales bacterium]|nr:MAG: DNA-protecting protein DprA [Spirochaetales bacterium]